MTHDELLALIDDYLQGCKDKVYMEGEEAYEALRAVVELHKPLNDYLWANSIICQCCTLLEKRITYPCPTIQAIEKELK